MHVSPWTIQARTAEDKHLVCSYVALWRISSTINQASGSSLNCSRLLVKCVGQFGWRGAVIETCLIQGGLGSFLLFGEGGGQQRVSHNIRGGRHLPARRDLHRRLGRWRPTPRWRPAWSHALICCGRISKRYLANSCRPLRRRRVCCCCGVEQNAGRSRSGAGVLGSCVSCAGWRGWSRSLERSREWNDGKHGRD
jgi:hypothetical protein